MTSKFQSYVDSVNLKNKFLLVLIPILLIVIFSFLQLLIDVVLGVLTGEIYYGSVEFVATYRLYQYILCDIIVILLLRFIVKYSPTQLGLGKEKFMLWYLRGSIFGIFQLLIVFLLIYILGGIDVTYGILNVPILVKALILFIFQGMFEEILYRGFLMPFFTKAMGIIATTLLTSLVFTWIHAYNPNVSNIALLAIFFAGITFSTIYYYTGNLWFVGAIHSFWNFFQGYIVGSPISGFQTYNSILFSFPVEGKDFISGGMFGFEASIVSVIVEILISSIFIYKIIKEKKLKGKKCLQEQED